MRYCGSTLVASLLLALPLQGRAAGGFRLSSPDFRANSLIPARCTCEGGDTSPALEIASVPAGTKSLMLIVEDPDAPGGTFTHWVAWNIAPGASKIAAGSVPAGALEGTNDFGKTGYSGPCPPSGTHRYFFRLSALDITLQLPAGASRNEVLVAAHGHVIGRADLMGKYAKTGKR